MARPFLEVEEDIIAKAVVYFSKYQQPAGYFTEPGGVIHKELMVNQIYEVHRNLHWWLGLAVGYVFSFSSGMNLRNTF